MYVVKLIFDFVHIDILMQTLQKCMYSLLMWNNPTVDCIKIFNAKMTFAIYQTN